MLSWWQRWADGRLTARVERLEARVRVLEAAVRLYGLHLPGCALSHQFFPIVAGEAITVRPALGEGDYDAGCTCNFAETAAPHRRGQDRLGSIG